jgi:AraC-like DNA-binding protein
MLEGRTSFLENGADARALLSRRLATPRRHLGSKPKVLNRADVRSPERELPCGMAALMAAVGYALSGDQEQARLSARIALDALDAEIAAKTSGVPRTAGLDPSKPGRSGLAPWQVRRVATYMEHNLANSIRCEDLARVTGLSVSHFMRAFRASFGAPPHAYLMRRRMERAQHLMLSTDTTIGRIALDCGFADQSHLTRLFRRIVGESPAAWRRARMYRSC